MIQAIKPIRHHYCDCGRVAVKLTGPGWACQRCLDIEADAQRRARENSRLSNSYGTLTNRAAQKQRLEPYETPQPWPQLVGAVSSHYQRTI